MEDQTNSVMIVHACLWWSLFSREVLPIVTAINIDLSKKLYVISVPRLLPPGRRIQRLNRARQKHQVKRFCDVKFVPRKADLCSFFYLVTASSLHLRIIFKIIQNKCFRVA